jgi:hypothetical protein
MMDGAADMAGASELDEQEKVRKESGQRTHPEHIHYTVEINSITVPDS